MPSGSGGSHRAYDCDYCWDFKHGPPKRTPSYLDDAIKEEFISFFVNNFKPAERISLLSQLLIIAIMHSFHFLPSSERSAISTAFTTFFQDSVPDPVSTYFKPNLKTADSRRYPEWYASRVGELDTLNTAERLGIFFNILSSTCQATHDGRIPPILSNLYHSLRDFFLPPLPPPPPVGPLFGPLTMTRAHT